MKQVETAGIFWHRLVVSAIVFQPLIFYRKHLIRLVSHIPFDIQGFHLPLATFMEHSARQGMWPFWDPFNYCGVPFSADITTQFFYPLMWLAIGVDVMTGGDRLFYWLHVLTALHMVIGGLGAYFLIRKLGCSPLVAFFGATVFQVGPFFASQAEHLGSICTAAWFPLILLSLLHLAEGFQRRWLGLLALSIGMGLLSGFPPTMLVVLGLASLFCVALIVAKVATLRLIPQFLGACVLGFGIAAIQLIPTLRLAARSIGSLRHEWLASGRGMPWESLVSFVWPNYYHVFAPWEGYKLGYEFTFLYTFCGHITVLLIALAPLFIRKSRLLAAFVSLWIVSAILMLGHQTPVYAVAYKFLPHTIQGSAYPETALLGFSLFAAITASLVLARLRPKLPLTILVLLVVANSWNLLRINANKVFNSFPGSYKEATAGWVDGGAHMPGALREMTATSTPPTRIDFLSIHDSGIRESADTFGIHSASSDNPFLLLNYYDLRRQFLNEGDTTRRLYFRDLDNPWIRALNIGYLIDDKMAPERPLGDSYELLPFAMVRIYKVKNPIPRYYLQNQIWPASNSDDARKRIQDPAFDPLKETVVENLPSGWIPAPDVTGSVRVVRYENNRVELRVQSSGRAILASSEILYPGWTAVINGRPAELLPVNLAFRGILVEPGENQIVMEYFPEAMTSSLLITVAALMITGLLVFKNSRRIPSKWASQRLSQN